MRSDLEHTGAGPRLLVAAAGDEVPAAEVARAVAAAFDMWPDAEVGFLRGAAPWQEQPPGQWDWITRLQAEGYDQAIILGDGRSSPYPLAYACYLAGIPFRSGVTSEFGGKLLTRRLDPTGPGQYPAPHELIEKRYQKER